jgi:alkylhydroperoxidase/carboxymuconolactone decarboxylase family protein YurZ
MVFADGGRNDAFQYQARYDKDTTVGDDELFHYFSMHILACLFAGATSSNIQYVALFLGLQQTGIIL